MQNDELLAVQFFVYEFSYLDLMKMCFSFCSSGQFLAEPFDYLDQFLLCQHTNVQN